MRPPAFSPIPYPGDARYVRDEVSGLVWHRVSQRVLFADTDRTGAVYHGNYFRFFELGRATLLRDAGFPLQRVEAEGYLYPIFQLGLDFFRPIEYDAPIFVHTRFRELAAVRVDFDYLVTHAETGMVLCRGFTRHCATNRTGRPVAVDPATVEVFQRFPA
jgi:acyl-CoA thioester hydrolase